MSGMAGNVSGVPPYGRIDINRPLIKKEARRPLCKRWPLVHDFGVLISIATGTGDATS